MQHTHGCHTVQSASAWRATVRPRRTNWRHIAALAACIALLSGYVAHLHTTPTDPPIRVTTSRPVPR